MSNDKLFIRRSEVRRRLGVSDEVISDLVAVQSLTPTYLPKLCRPCRGKRCKQCHGTGQRKGYAFFKTAEVEALAKQTDTETKRTRK